MKQYSKIFLQHPDREELFVSSDGYAFWEKSHAEGHASRLADKGITTVSRAEALAPETKKPESVENEVPISEEVEALIGVEAPAEVKEQPVIDNKKAK